MYRVLRPFKMNGKLIPREEVFGKEAEGWANFNSLKRAKYIERMASSDGSSYKDGFYVARKSFSGAGQDYSYNDLIDLREVSWPNLRSLISSGYLRYATEKDVARHAAHSPLETTEAATPCPSVAPKIWKSRAWLVDRYITNMSSMPDMAKEAGCSVSSIWGALKDAGIETRPRGRPNHGGFNGYYK